MSKLHVLIKFKLRNCTNFSRLILFFSLKQRKRANNCDINDDDYDNDFIMTDPDHTAAFLSEESTISMYRRYLPVQLTPFQKYPGSLHIHKKDPLVLWHMKLPLQLCFPVAHSFTSAKQEARLLDTIQFAFFLNSRSPSEDYWETVFSNHSDDYRRNWFQSESYF